MAERPAPAEREELLADLDAARDAFLDALAEVDADLVTTPGVVEDWSVRDILVHVGAWAEHGTAALEMAVAGHGNEFAYDTSQTDAMNARIQAEAATVSPSAALEREAAAFARFRALLATLDPAVLDQVLGNGDSVRAVVRYDGANHYAEHTEHLRAWFTPDDDEPREG